MRATFSIPVPLVHNLFHFYGASLRSNFGEVSAKQVRLTVPAINAHESLSADAFETIDKIPALATIFTAN